MMRSFIVAGASRTALTGGGLRKKRVAPTRPLCPFSPGTRRQALEEREERGPGGGDEVARHVVERNLASHAHVWDPGPARRSTTGRIDADERQDDPGPQQAHRVDQVVDALVPPRRPEKHHDLVGAHPLPGARVGAIVSSRIPRLGIAHVGQERPAEAALEESRGHRDCVGTTDELLRKPRPREPVRIGEVEGATDPAPGARAIEEADLPVVDVEDERPPPACPREQAKSEARRPRFGRDEDLAVDELEELGNVSCESGIAPGPHAAIIDRAVPRRRPEAYAELRPDHADLVARRKETSEQVGTTRRVVRQVGGEDGDLLNAPAAWRLAYRASSAAATWAPEYRCSTSLCPASPSRARAAGSLTSLASASASASASPAGTSVACSPSASTSRTTPTRDAMSGRPAARHSKTTRDMPSDSSGT